MFKRLILSRSVDDSVLSLSSCTALTLVMALEGVYDAPP